MPTNKEAARVLAHPNGQRCELTQIHNHILLHAVRFGKVFCKTCAVLEVVANNINFCGSKADNPGQTSTAPAGQPNVGAPAPAYNQGPGDDFALIEDEGDLPF